MIPPHDLRPDERAIWRQIEAQAPEGHLLPQDGLLLEMASCLIAQQQRDPASFPADKAAVLRGMLDDLGVQEFFRLH